MGEGTNVLIQGILVLDGDPTKIGAQSVGFGKALAVGRDLEREDL